jgi:hypothetical protein
MAHEPRALYGHSKDAPELVSANALLAGSYQGNRLKPDVQRNVGILENGPYAHGKGLAAVVALHDAHAGAFARKPPNALYAATVRAGRASGPNAGFYERESRGFVVKVKGGIIRGHDQTPNVQRV